MKKIHDIISSELVARTNNIRLKQEFGQVGIDTNITSEGTSTIFTTKFVIQEINYITVNGINLIEGVHYTTDTEKTIKISNKGAPVRKNPSLTTTILVSYYTKPAVSSYTKVPPVINSFTLNSYLGRAGEIIFDFNIAPFDGKNIYWSILKDGDKTPLYSGNSTSTSGGYSYDADNVATKLNHFISNTEYAERQGGKIPFTFVVVYDLTNDGSILNERLLSSAVYVLEANETVTGNLSVTPGMISTAGAAKEIAITYNINDLGIGGPSYEWAITRSKDGAVETTLRYGNQASVNLADTFTETVATVAGDNFEYRYFLKVKAIGSTDYTTVANDKTVIAVPVGELVAHAGYLDAAIMSYIDPEDSVRKKIGSLGTAQDLVEYNNRVPGEIFTKDITKVYLTNEEFINPFLNDFGGTVTAVYFVIELPDNWGPVDFYQTLGLVSPTAFNIIPLGNGYTAYLYKDAPSAVANPSDYYLKSRV
jgi:hypothetical protein